MVWTITSSNPAYNYTGGVSGATGAVPCHMIAGDERLSTVSACVAFIKADILDKYNLDTDSALNNFQQNSTVIIKQDAFWWFRGFVVANPMFRSTGEGSMMEVQIWGTEGVLTNSIVPDTNGDPSWLLETDSIKVTDLPLKAASAYGDFEGDTLWPDPADATGVNCWVSDALSNSDTLAGQILVGATAPFSVTLSTSSKGFNPRGWLKINNEVMYYEGYQNSSGDYVCSVVARAQLGTSAATHNISDTVYEKVCKQIAVGYTRLERKIDSADYLMIRIDKEVQSVPKLGCYVLSGPTEPAPAVVLYRGTYYIYDEDTTLGGSTIITVNDIVKKICTAPLAYGGAGWTTYDVTGINQGTKTITILGNYASLFPVGDYVAVSESTGNDGFYTIVSATDSGADTLIVVSEAISDATVDGWISMQLYLHSSTAAILVNRFEYDQEDKPKNAWDTIENLLNGLSIEDQVKMYYRHDIGKLRLRVMANDTKYFSVPHCERVEVERTIQDVRSAVQVEFKGDQEVNAIYTMYHQAATGSGTSPDEWRALKGESGSWDMPIMSTSTAAGDFGVKYCTDGDPNTALLAHFDDSPGGSFSFADFVFGSGTTPPSIPMKNLSLKINSWRTIDTPKTYKNTSKTYICRIEGATDYSTTTHTGTFKDLGFAIEGEPNKNGKWVEGKTDAFKFKRVNCVRVIWDYMPGPVGGDKYWAAIHDIEIVADKRYVLVQLTDNIALAANPNYIYAPSTFTRLRGGSGAYSGVAGAQNVLPYDIGVGNDTSAISAARTLLLTKLTQSEARHYEYTGLLPKKPELGLTIGVDEDGDDTDDYTGVVQSFSWQVVNTIISVQAAVLNYDAVVLV